MTTHHGFILHPTYRMEAGRPVVHLFGRLEDGRSFLARDRRPVPHFFVREADATTAREHGAARQTPTGLRTMHGDPVVRVEVDAPDQTPPLREGLHRAGVPVYEADVRFAMRYLIDRGIKGSLTIAGEGRLPGGTTGASPAGGAGPAQPAVDVVFDEPDVTPSDFSPGPGLLRILSIDLETDPRGESIYSAALAGTGGEEVLLALPADRVARALGDRGPSERVVPCGDERGLLRALFDRMRRADFDVLTGWNVIDFDLEVLAARSRALGVPFEVGRAPGAVRVIRERAFWGRSRADVGGRVVLDGIELMRSSFMKLEDYRLDTAARTVLGEGKVDLGASGPSATGRDKAQAIDRTFHEDLPLFVQYNLADARLVLAILEKTRLVELAVRRSLLTGMPLDRVGASIASFDVLYLHELRRRGFVAPTVGGGDAEPAGAGAQEDAVTGGAVLDPLPGLYENVLAFDFKSLYPSLIRTFNLDPLGHVTAPAQDDGAGLIRAPNGALFRREPGILPGILERLFPQREDAKARGDTVGSHAIKILMNSFYGVLATPACRFYSLPVANAITQFGQWVLHGARDRMEGLGHPVLYGDTDSLFVESGLAGPGAAEAALRLGATLRDRINDELGREIRQAHGVESQLELEFESLFVKFLLPSVRHGVAGARKRYAGLVRTEDPGSPGKMVFVGMEVVRRDWTELSKIFQRGLFDRLFHGVGRDDVLAYTRDFARDLKEGRHDEHLVYRKALRKGLDEYTTTTPPHVKAARLVEGKVDGLIEYLMTVSGPQPASARSAPIDYLHYVEKQLRPIAEQVFPHLGLSFDEALGEARQMPLF